MTDRELLELAAKACGQEYWVVRLGPRTSITEHLHYKGVNGETQEWNPLVDDGDALRLAVKLDIEIYQADDDDGTAIYAGYWRNSKIFDARRIFCIEPIAQDPCAATRRAIVRAAAEVGKQMGGSDE